MEYTGNLYRIVRGAKVDENIIGHTPILEQAKNAAYGYAQDTGEMHSVWQYFQGVNMWELVEAYSRAPDKACAELGRITLKYGCYEVNRMRYDSHRLWKQGIRSGDKTIIQLQYGYDDKDTEIICAQLAEWESAANHRLKYYNPELGF